VSQLNPDPNRYAPPRAHIVDSHRTPGIKPRRVNWAVTALCVAYGLSFIHAAIGIGNRWILWPPESVVLIQLASELFYAAIIYFVSSGRNWALLIYAVLLGVRTVIVIRYFPDDWKDPHWLVLVTIISFSCQYMAMYWLYTGAERRWFVRPPADPLRHQ
jgi:hypothetical protein